MSRGPAHCWDLDWQQVVLGGVAGGGVLLPSLQPRLWVQGLRLMEQGHSGLNGGRELRAVRGHGVRGHGCVQLVHAVLATWYRWVCARPSWSTCIHITEHRRCWL
jgi:hypothetical protein